jgi:hypothetical protein
VQNEPAGGESVFLMRLDSRRVSRCNPLTRTECRPNDDERFEIALPCAAKIVSAMTQIVESDLPGTRFCGSCALKRHEVDRRVRLSCLKVEVCRGKSLQPSSRGAHAVDPLVKFCPRRPPGCSMYECKLSLYETAFENISLWVLKNEKVWDTS